MTSFSSVVFYFALILFKYIPLCKLLLKICWINYVPWLWFSYRPNALYSRAFSIYHITWSNKSILSGIQAWSINPWYWLCIVLFLFCFFFFFRILFVTALCHTVSKPTNLFDHIPHLTGVISNATHVGTIFTNINAILTMCAQYRAVA